MSLYLLLFAGLCVFLFAASLDDFFHLWDERFHALVAKNMMENPFEPRLYKNGILDIDYSHWALAEVWLHKQPLFLWQSALSFQCFGVSPLTYRLPSVVMACVMNWAIYRSVKQLFSDQVAYIASVLFISSSFFIGLVNGSYGLGQNDLIFIGYITLSTWCFIEYRKTQHVKWLVGLALFSGAAVLTKWLVGLLVYLIWGFFILLSKRFSELKQLLYCFILTAAVFLPWQVFCYLNYPKIYTEEMNYNFLHLFEAVEGHQGTMLFHFERFGEIYGVLAIVGVMAGLLLLVRKRKMNKLLGSFMLATCFVYLFFSLAQTKMIGFTAVNVLFIYVLTAFALKGFLDLLAHKVQSKRWQSGFFFATIIIVILSRFDIEKWQEKHTAWKGGTTFYKSQKHNVQLLKELDLEKNEVLFNFPYYYYVDAMFYTENIAYSFIPSEEQLEELEDKGYKAVILRNKQDQFDAYLRESSNVRILEKSLY